MVSHLFGETEFINVCQEISNEIIKLLTTSRLKGESLGQKVGLGADGEPTHKIDALAEQRAIELIKQSEFQGRIITEEQGTIPLGETQETIWLDPIDGTRNTYRNIPYYALSVAYFSRNVFKSGYVRNLANGDEFLAQAGIATLNGNRLKTISRPLKQVGIVVIRPRTKKGFACLHFLQQRVRFLRMMGAAALDIAYIASGAIDTFLDLDRGLKSVDYAAAQPILELVGGAVSDIHGQPVHLHEDLTVRVQMLATSNFQLHSQLLGLLQEFGYTK